MRRAPSRRLTRYPSATETHRELALRLWKSGQLFRREHAGFLPGHLRIRDVLDSGKGLILHAGYKSPLRRRRMVRFPYIQSLLEPPIKVDRSLRRHTKVLVYYPKTPQAASHLGSTVTSLQDDLVPGRHVPGSIGSLCYTITYKNSRPVEVQIGNLQGSFVIESNPAFLRPIQREHRRWQHQLLQLVFDEAKANGIKIVRMNPSGGTGGERNWETFRAIALQNGYSGITKMVTEFVARLPTTKGA